MKLSKKIQIIINAVLFLTVVIVGVIAFLPEKSVTISSGNGVVAIYNGDRNSNTVALTFNVYENTDIVNGILNELKKEDVKATFFVGGCWADDNQTTLRRIINEGHELGNHGYYHKDHKKLDKDNNLKEISSCGRIVFALTGYQMRLFAPPSGSFSKTTLSVANELGYQTIMWSKDTIDWRDNSVSLIVKRATENITSGDIILMHPKPHTLTALPEIIKNIKKANLNAVTVSECANLTVNT